jgi:hypothetical protein
MIDKATCERDVAVPGKFEGESPETRYFYEVMLHGDGEIVDAGPDGSPIVEFELTDADPKWIHDNAETSRFRVYVDGDGFVNGWWVR